MKNTTSRQVLEVVYSAGLRFNRIAYFASEAEFEAWLNVPARVEDPNFMVDALRTVTVGTAVDFRAYRAAAQRQAGSHFVVGGGKPTVRVPNV